MIFHKLRRNSYARYGRRTERGFRKVVDCFEKTNSEAGRRAYEYARSVCETITSVSESFCNKPNTSLRHCLQRLD